jgi:hypothetical protein
MKARAMRRPVELPVSSESHRRAENALPGRKTFVPSSWSFAAFPDSKQAAGLSHLNGASVALSLPVDQGADIEIECSSVFP